MDVYGTVETFVLEIRHSHLEKQMVHRCMPAVNHTTIHIPKTHIQHSIHTCLIHKPKD